MSTRLIAVLAAFLLLLSSLVGVFSWVDATRTTGVQLEAGLVATYENNQNERSAYVTSFYEQLGVAKLKSAKLDTILTHAVEGRYGDAGAAGGSLATVIAEAYPQLTQLDIYDRVIDHIKGGQEQFKARQTLLLDQLRAYDTWRESGLIQSSLIRFLGFPSARLEARVGGKAVASGPAALAQMRTLVLIQGTAQEFQTGQGKALID